MFLITGFRLKVVRGRLIRRGQSLFVTSLQLEIGKQVNGKVNITILYHIRSRGISLNLKSVVVRSEK